MNLSFVPQSWYPLCASNELRRRPRLSRLAGDPLCLFRDDRGEAQCVSDVCPHRGAPLHAGRVREGRIACPYHGFEFDGTGRLRFVPSETGCRVGACESCPESSILRAYPTRETGGYVWAFYDRSASSDDLPLLAMATPIPTPPELSDPSWFFTQGEYAFDSPWQPVFENALDNSHIHFLHADSFGNPNAPEIRDVETRATDPGVAEATFTLTNKPVNPLWAWTRTPEVRVTARAYLPSVSYIRFELGGGISFLTYVATVPIDAQRTVNRYALGRTRFPGRVFDPWARRAMEKIFSEDRAMIESLYSPEMYTERSVRADALQLLWRKQVRTRIDDAKFL